MSEAFRNGNISLSNLSPSCLPSTERRVRIHAVWSAHRPLSLSTKPTTVSWDHMWADLSYSRWLSTCQLHHIYFFTYYCISLIWLIKLLLLLSSWPHFSQVFDHSCIVHPCHIVPICPLLQIPSFQHGAELSTPANSAFPKDLDSQRKKQRKSEYNESFRVLKFYNRSY